MRALSAIAMCGGLALLGCGDLVGFGGPVEPLARISVEVTGDLAPLRPPGTDDEMPRLRVAVVWGAQWLPEPFCLLPAESPEAATVIAAGCSDPFRFVPARVQANIEIQPDVPATIELMTLPAADVLVGALSSRVGYASLVVYDDRDGNETLDLQPAHEDPEGVIDTELGEWRGDLTYGTSFGSMTMPDQRIAFREGAFDARAAFYPRAGCEGPPPAFSVLRAGGFTATEAIAASLRGELPLEDPATCEATKLDDVTISIPLVAPASVKQAKCIEDFAGTRYHEPPVTGFDLSRLTWACASLPHFGDFDRSDPAETQQQLVIANPENDACVGMFHFVLRGCDYDPTCGEPEWSWIATPPLWWPCPLQ